MMETPDSEWRIRPSKATDYDAVIRLYDEAVVWLNGRGVTEQWGVTPVSSRPHLVAEIQEYLGHATVAENEAGDIVGFIAVEFPATEAAQNDAAYVHSLVARRTPDVRGAGAFLLHWAEAAARRRGLKALRMAKWKNNPKLTAYYRSLGFTEPKTAWGSPPIALLEKRFPSCDASA